MAHIEQTLVSEVIVHIQTLAAVLSGLQHWSIQYISSSHVSRGVRVTFKLVTVRERENERLGVSLFVHSNTAKRLTFVFFSLSLFCSSDKLFGKRLLQAGRHIMSHKSWMKTVPTENCDVLMTFPGASDVFFLSLFAHTLSHSLTMYKFV